MNSSDYGQLSRADMSETRELAHGAIGSARVTAFGMSNVAGTVAGGLVIAVPYAGFATPLVVLIARSPASRPRPRSAKKPGTHAAPSPPAQSAS